MAQYSIHKENTPEKTVENIKNILKELSIHTTEELIKRNNSKCNVTSVRVQIENSIIGTNGKGICKKNSLASGYAEFMERLQTGFLVDYGLNSFVLAPDEILKSISSFEDTLIYKEIKNNRLIQDILKLERQIHSKKKRNVVYLPYISVKNKTTEYLPALELFFLQASNGLAAGNTKYEALVQGLSEICERYVVHKILEEKTALPIIPLDFYDKYDDIIQTIKYIESFGYKISVRDASCKKQLPVVAITVEDKNKNVEISFGAHPSFPVALERCLTEYMQGYKIEDELERKKRANFCQTRIKYNNTALKTTRIYAAPKSKLYNKILVTKKDFNRNLYLNKDNFTNEQMYKILRDKILQYFDDIYIRDYSFLNFPTISIYIPRMSLMNIGMDKKSLKNLRNLLQLEKAILNNNLKKFPIKKILGICEYYIDNNNDRFITKTISYLPLEVIALFASILLKDKKKTDIYLDKAIKLSDKFSDKKSQNIPFEMFKILKEYFNLSNKQESEESIINTLGNKKYYYIKGFLDKLSENRFKQLLQQNQFKEKSSNKIKDIERILTEAYKNNIPCQNDIKDII